MRFATAPSGSRSRNHFVGLGTVAVLTVGIAACASSAGKPNPPVDAGPSGDTSAASDVRPDIKADIRPDLPPVDLGMPLCEGTEPTNDFLDPYVIMDFNDGSGTPFTGPHSNGSVGQGGTYTTDVGYPVSDFSGNNWHLTAMVGPTDNAHFGIYWQCILPNAGGGCTLDVSRFKGLSFKVKGNAGPDHQMTLSLGRAQNDTNIQNAGCGSCKLPPGSDASTDNYCVGPRAFFTVPADGSEATVTVLWTDFHSGSPYDSIDPHQITGILWIFHDPAAADGGAGNDGSTDAPADAPMSINDGSASDAGLCSSDGGGVCDGGAGDAGTGPGYNADITIDDITLVPF
jgi:hypothetical protein